MTFAKRNRLAADRSLVYFSVLGLVAICAIFGLVLHDSHEDAKRQAVQAAANLTTLVDQDISRNIELYDLSLQAVIDGYANPAIMALAPSIRQLTLFDRSATADGLGSIFVFDSAGNAVLSSVSETPPAVNAADREFFRVHAQATTDLGLYVSHPFRSRVRPNEWVIGLSRRLTHADGSFAGVIVGTIRLSYFEGLSRRLVLGDRGIAAILNDDGTIISSTPVEETLVGRNVRQVIALFTHYKERNFGSYEAGAIDGVNRLYSYRQIGSLPLVFVVGISTQEIFKEWWQRAVLTAASLVGLCCAVLALTLKLSSELRLRRHAEIELSVLAKMDKLTSLPNRRSFDERLSQQWSRAARGGEPLSLLMIDADQFKAYNDTYGHLRGDAVLASIARCLESACGRSTDFAARFGGEEFAVLLPHTDLAGAVAVAERIRAKIDGQNIPHAASDRGRVSVSIGVACIAGLWRNGADELVRDADQAMYAAKAAGRNCIRSAERTSNVVTLNVAV